MEARAPDGRTWTVRQIWWPRPTQLRLQADIAYSTTSRRGGFGAVFAPVFYAVLVAVWPLVVVLKIVFRARWLVEAVPENNMGVEGVCWRIRGWANSRSAVDEVARAIVEHRKPNLSGAKLAEFERRPPKATHGVSWR